MPLSTQADLGFRDRNRDITESDDGYPSREAEKSYGPDFAVENRAIGPKSVNFWDVSC
jgi:hypothetical protein